MSLTSIQSTGTSMVVLPAETRVQRTSNLLSKPPKMVMVAHLTAFLTGKDLANLKSTFTGAGELGTASYIIKRYQFAPIIQNLFELDVTVMVEFEKSKVLSKLMDRVQGYSLSMEGPSYKGVVHILEIADELADAESFLKRINMMQNTMLREHQTLPGLPAERLEIPNAPEARLVKAKQMQGWWKQYEAEIDSIVDFHA